MAKNLRLDWRKKAEGNLAQVCAERDCVAKWSAKQNAVQICRMARGAESRVEINALRVIIFAATGKVMDEEAGRIRDVAREEFGRGSVRGRAFGDVEDCYFQKSGNFAIIPMSVLPVSKDALAEVVEAAFMANDWLAQLVSELPKRKMGLGNGSTAKVVAVAKREMALGLEVYRTVGLLIRLIESGGLPERARKSILSRVCHVADLVPATFRSVAAEDCPRNERWREHAVPCDYLVQELRRMIVCGSSDDSIADALARCLVVVEISREERRRLDCVQSLKTVMPPGWQIAIGDPFERFKRAGIVVNALDLGL